MNRRLFNYSVFSLLCAVIFVSWVRSYFVADVWVWSDGADRPRHVYRMGHKWDLTLLRGHVYLVHDTSWWFEAQFRHFTQDNLDAALPPFVARRSALGFEWAEDVGVPSPSNVSMPPFLLYRIVGIPHGFFVACATFPIYLQLLRRRRLRRRLREGLCFNCGYDLRANKDCCPECGMPMSAQVARATALGKPVFLP
jgi:hypothetical protein